MAQDLRLPLDPVLPLFNHSIVAGLLTYLCLSFPHCIRLYQAVAENHLSSGCFLDIGITQLPPLPLLSPSSSPKSTVFSHFLSQWMDNSLHIG
jgi:hypothetical protein